LSNAFFRKHKSSRVSKVQSVIFPKHVPSLLHSLPHHACFPWFSLPFLASPLLLAARRG
jgi:hypothetical protein